MAMRTVLTTTSAINFFWVVQFIGFLVLNWENGLGKANRQEGFAAVLFPGCISFFLGFPLHRTPNLNLNLFSLLRKAQ
jgi:hypothetical protein